MPSRTSTQLLAHRVRWRPIGRSARSDDDINRMVGTSTRTIGRTCRFRRVLDNPKHTPLLDRHLTRLEVFGRTLIRMVQPVRRTRSFFVGILQLEWSLGRPVTNDHLGRTSTATQLVTHRLDSTLELQHLLGQLEDLPVLVGVPLLQNLDTLGTRGTYLVGKL